MTCTMILQSRVTPTFSLSLSYVHYILMIYLNNLVIFGTSRLVDLATLDVVNCTNGPSIRGSQ